MATEALGVGVPWEIGQLATGVAAWRGPELAARAGEWTIYLSPDDIAEIDEGVCAVRAERGEGAWRDPEPQFQFPLSQLAEKLRDAVQDLREGFGFVLLRGLPVSRYSLDEAKTVLRGIASHLGVCVSQNHRGDLIGEVIDRSDEVSEPRRYEAGGEFRMHVDPVDIVGLMCIRKAKRGGESRIVSSISVHNALLQERPELLRVLYDGFRLYRPYPDRGSSGPLTARPVPFFAADRQGRFAAHFLPDPALQAVEKEDIELSALEKEALDYVERVAGRESLTLKMSLRPGDVQFLNNRTVLHSRAAYEDHFDKSRRRLMLRIWLMNADWAPLAAEQQFFDQSHRLGGGIMPAPQATHR